MTTLTISSKRKRSISSLMASQSRSVAKSQRHPTSIALKATKDSDLKKLIRDSEFGIPLLKMWDLLHPHLEACSYLGVATEKELLRLAKS